MSDIIPANKTSSQIGLVKESSLHAALKKWYSQPDDVIEKNVMGYYIDIVRGNQLIEIQTSNFSAISKKIQVLLEAYPVHLVYPLIVKKWIKKISADGTQTIRKSPKKGRLEDIFWEVVKIPKCISYPNFSLEVVSVLVEETWVIQPVKTRRSSWRRKGWAIQDRQLLNVIDRVNFSDVADYSTFLEEISDDQIFSSSELAKYLSVQISLARKMIYTFRNIGLIHAAGKKRNTFLYKKVNTEKAVD